MRLLALALLSAPLAWAAEVCPQPKVANSAGSPGPISWTSFHAEPRPQKFCVGNEVRNESAEPVEVAWNEAGVERATLKSELRMAECCFDAVAAVKAKLLYGTNSVEIIMQHAAEEGLANHEEGYPDLIEEDARVRMASIRGTLWAEGKPLRIDLQLKCTASQFAKQYAYQYSITDRSPDPVEIEWNLVSAMRRHTTPAVQPIPSGKTYLFLADKAPQEAEGRIEVRTKSGSTAAVFRLDGFAIDPR